MTTLPSTAAASAAIIACILAATVVGCQTGGASRAQPAPTTRATADKPARQPQPSEQPGQRRFESPQAAAAALKEAVRMRDRQALLQIFGPDGHDLIFSGDPVQERNALNTFDKHLGEQLRVDRASNDKATLYIGAENWPFPIPLVSDSSQWYFDTSAGKDEILNRRIGRNELETIDVCHAYVRAQQEYARADRTGEHLTQYARRFRSEAGKHDGLYWEPTDAGDFSPMGSLVAEAESEGYGKTPLKQHHTPYHGYYYRILTAQGAAAPGGATNYIVDGHLTKGFALIAFPAKWGDSGVMSFILNQDDKIYQQDLGPQTDEKACAIADYNPDKSWQLVRE